MTEVPKPLNDTFTTLYGKDAPDVVSEFKAAFRPRVMEALALYCNAQNEIRGANEYERGVEEGKRRVWLWLATILRLRLSDFPQDSTGDE